MWTDEEKLKSLLAGITQAHELFFPMFPLKQFARLVVCECAQESTLAWNLGADENGRISANLDDHKSYGVIQNTMAAGIKEYQNYGMPFADFDPSKISSIDLTDPRVCVLQWAWFTYNTVQAGISLTEYANRKAWNPSGIGKVKKIYANVLFNWLAGGANDVTTPDGSKAFKDYHDRIQAYWVHGKFGTDAEFDDLINTSIEGEIKYVKDVA